MAWWILVGTNICPYKTTSKEDRRAMPQNSRGPHSCSSQYTESIKIGSAQLVQLFDVSLRTNTHFSLWTLQSLKLCSDWLKLGSTNISKLINEVTGLNQLRNLAKAQSQSWGGGGINNQREIMGSKNNRCTHSTVSKLLISCKYFCEISTLSLSPWVHPLSATVCYDSFYDSLKDIPSVQGHSTLCLWSHSSPTGP